MKEIVSKQTMESIMKQRGSIVSFEMGLIRGIEIALKSADSG